MVPQFWGRSFESKLPEIEKKYGINSPEGYPQYQLIKFHDEINKEKIKVIVNKYGWLGKQAAGKYYVAKMRDPRNVDKRRLAVGTNPIKEYVS